MADSFDAIVIGMGPGGEVVASRLLDAGRRIAVVERELIGGECGYWACVPSKTLLRPPETRAEADKAEGVATPALDWPAAAAWRDEMTRHLDDAKQVREYQERGAEVLRGSGRLAGPGRVEVGDRTLTAPDVVLATGSDPVVPSTLEGLGDAVWTNREATQLREIPERAVVLGGGPVGLELGQFLARFGCQVTLVQSAERLINREDPRVGELAARALEREGVRVHAGRRIVGASRRDGERSVELDDGSRIATDVVVVGAGRTPRAAGLGLESVGASPGKRGVAVDQRCRVAEGLWAVGDVTGVALFTHVAKYQARVVAANLLGGARVASYQGVPRVVFTDPELAAVGLTEPQAREQGYDVVTATVDLAAEITRPWTYEHEPAGELGLVADRRRRVLLGAWAVAPLAAEWIHQAAMAVRAEIPIDVLLDGVAQFPTWSEGHLTALERLELA
jgi:pyruvate/2-oxoglutarate dehydrogenase complex dihydrolipoamide dehydrogenase (E3) component